MAILSNYHRGKNLVQTYQTYPNMEDMPALSPYGLQYSPTEHL